MKPGTIVVVEFPGAMGIKRRPAVVISTTAYHSERPDVILAVVTSRIDRAKSKTDYILQDWADAELSKPSAVRMYIGTRESSQTTVIGNLSETDWLEVQRCLRMSLECGA